MWLAILSSYSLFCTPRATYQSDAGDLDSALRDINRAIALRSLLPAAYALRSKLRMETLADKLCDPEEEQRKTEAAAAVDEAERAELLQQAAEDGLLGESCFAILSAADVELGLNPCLYCHYYSIPAGRIDRPGYGGCGGGGCSGGLQTLRQDDLQGP